MYAFRIEKCNPADLNAYQVTHLKPPKPPAILTFSVYQFDIPSFGGGGPRYFSKVDTICVVVIVIGHRHRQSSYDTARNTSQGGKRWLYRERKRARDG